MPGSLQLPVPDDPTDLNRMLSEGWTLMARSGEPAYMLPPKELADALGFAAFVKDVETRAVAAERARLRALVEGLAECNCGFIASYDADHTLDCNSRRLTTASVLAALEEPDAR